MRRELITLLFCGLFLLALPYRTEAGKPYKIRVVLINNQVATGRLLYVTHDSLVLLSKTIGKQRIAVHDIRKIWIRRKGDPGKGALAGAGIGALSGLLVGYFTYEKPNCSGFFCFDIGPEGEAITLGVLLAPVGALIGLLSKSGKEFKIDQDQGAYNQWRWNYNFGESQDSLVSKTNKLPKP